MPHGHWKPPKAGRGAPPELKDLLDNVYSSFRDKHPGENPATKAQGAAIAWGAAHKAGWKKVGDMWKRR